MAKIRIRGACENNLKNVDVDLAEGLTVVTGVSGSGKSSLVFDTLYHEAHRRLMDVFHFGGGLRFAPARVASLSGVGPAVAVEQNLLNRNPSSTLASFSGLHPFLRLLYARFGQRSCPGCGAAFSVLSEDEIVSEVTAIGAKEPIVLFMPLLRGVSGSHRTLMRMLTDKFGRDALRLDGRKWDGQALDPGFAHHLDIEIARWEGGIPALQAREVVKRIWEMGADSLAVETYGDKTHNAEIHGAETPSSTRILSRAPVCSQCGTWLSKLEPMHFHLSCPQCQGAGCPACSGTGLHPEATSTRWSGLRLTDLLALSVEDALLMFSQTQLPDTARRLHDEIIHRLEALDRVGLGYISLDRTAPTLSRGESQRVRLAVILISRLEDMLHVLDEPTVGQHPADVARLIEAFRDLPGPVVFVEHDRVAAAAADHAVDLGPGAGTKGGEVIFTGTPAELWRADTDSGRYFSLRDRVHAPSTRPIPDWFLLLRGASVHNLNNIDIPFALGRLNVVAGVSGSGKSTLVREVLVPTLATGMAVGCREFAFVQPSGMTAQPKLPETIFVDQSPIGRNPRSNPATYTKLADVVRDFWATQTGLSPSHFSFNRPEGACPSCKGLGSIEVPMRYLPSTWIPCEDCNALRFSDEVLAAGVPFGAHNLTISDLYGLTIQEVADLLLPDPRLSPSQRKVMLPILSALCDIGLGYVQLGQPSPTLSGGEAQRIKLAKYLGRQDLSDNLFILDEPSTGLHPKDIAGLLSVLDRLVRNGATVVVVEHDTDTIRAADWLIDLGPGAGPKGGCLVYSGKPEGILDEPASLTGRALHEEASVHPADHVSVQTAGAAFVRPEDLVVGHAATRQPKTVISIRNATANNLKGISVDIPKGKLVVVTGVSGSGKSSLIGDVLESEARRRLMESFSMYERQGLREGPEAQVDEIRGLGVVASVGSTRGLNARRATVGTATELSHHLAILMAFLGERRCHVCGHWMERHQDQWLCTQCGMQASIVPARYFQPAHYNSACTTCNGIGSRRKPNPEKLIIRPDLPLCAGAMYSPGFFPKGYLCKPYNGGYDHVLAHAAKYGYNPVKTPWNSMSEEARHTFLFGDPEPMPVRFESRNGRIHSEMRPFPGFYGWVRDWDVGGTYTDTEICPACGGSRLRTEYLAVTLDGYNLHELNTMPLSALHAVLKTIAARRSKEFPGMVSRDESGMVSLDESGMVSRDESGMVSRDEPSKIGREGSGIGHQAEPSLQTCLRRLRFLIQAGVGYVHLDRPANSVSAGEAQRLSLAGLLGSGLTSLTVLLDEPTRGLHPSEVRALVEALLDLRGPPEQDASNTILVVEHDPEVLRAADYIIDMGPGAGANGGMIVAQGSPEEVSWQDTATARWLRGESRPMLQARREPERWMRILGAEGNNLKNIDVSLPLGTLVGLCGVSGSGKSTLMVDTLGLALAPKKQTTSVAYENVEPERHRAILHAPKRVVVVDQTRTGINNPADFLGLNPVIHGLYAESEDARALEMDAEMIGRHCTVCGGSGFIRTDMGFLPDILEACEPCRGTGYRAEAWDLRLRGVPLPGFFDLTIDEVLEKFGDEENLSLQLKTAQHVGLGYLTLRQPGHSLSGGEAQRLKIARELSRKTKKEEPSLFILDEPTLGLHLEDVAVLVKVLHRLVDGNGDGDRDGERDGDRDVDRDGDRDVDRDGNGGMRNTVLVVEHHPHVLAACDWLVELGPVGGPDGGYLVAEGTPEQVAAGTTPTAPYLREVLANAQHR